MMAQGTRAATAFFLVAFLFGLFGAPVLAAGDKSKGWLGVRFAPDTGGVRVLAVHRRSPADEAGLKAGDLLRFVNDEAIESARGFAKLLRKTGHGQDLQFGLRRAGKELSIKVHVVSRDLPAMARRALLGAVAAISKRQRKDGGWRRQERDVTGAGITALITRAFAELPAAIREPQKAVIERALRYLEAHINKAGIVMEEEDAILPYANFATALMLKARLALGYPASDAVNTKLRDGLIETQLDAEEKFSSYDWQYGSWDFNDINKRRSVRANIMVTSAAVEALRAAGLKTEHPCLQRARRFVFLCQNWRRDPEPILAPLLDGGFAESPRASKAGLRNLGDAGLLFRSTGTSTADGLRTLLLLGLDEGSPRVKAARSWLERNAQITIVPGFGPRPAVRFDQGLLLYYLNTLTRCYEAVGSPLVRTPRGRRLWPLSLAELMVATQRPDDLWVNQSEVMGEHVPELGTAFAIQVLTISLKNAEAALALRDGHGHSPKRAPGSKKKPATPDKKPATPDKKPATPEKKPATPDKKPATPDKKPATPDKKPATPDKKPAAPDKKPAAPDKKPTAPEKPATPRRSQPLSR